MEAKPREELFRKYVQCLQRRLEEGERKEGRGGAERTGEAELLVEATALLMSQLLQPAQRFHVVPFYEVAENALRSQRDAGLRGLEMAFATLETVCANLLLFPWKKEFRCIKTFTGPYVYNLKAALCDSDLRSLLRSMGYTRDQELRLRAGDPPGGVPHLRQLAFELFLARAECRLLGEMAAKAGGSVTEAGVLEARRSGARDEGRQRAEAEQSREKERERAYLRRSVRLSKSVDVADGAGSWQPQSRPVLRASLSLRKEPRCVDPEAAPADGLHRPSALPPCPPCPPRLQARTPPAETLHLGSLDELDLYTERGLPLHHPPALPRRTLSRDLWGSRGQGAKCQGCGRWCPGPATCPQSNGSLCTVCCAEEPVRSCNPQDYPKSCPRPLEGHLLAKEKLSVYPSPQARSPLPEKPLLAPKPYLGKPASIISSGNGSSILAGGSRCGFCNKPSASHTCLSCSKVSCSVCMSLYSKDVCGRKNLHHNFVSNHQLNYKSAIFSHLVYR